MTIGDNIKSLASSLSYLFYPHLCEGCNKPLLAEDEVLCLDCNVYNLPRTAYHHLPENETAMRFAGRLPFIKATSFAYFTPDGLLQHLLHRLKYEDRKGIGIFLGKQLGYDLEQVKWADGIDAIIPIPLHQRKLSARGYNQSELIALGINHVLHIPVIANALIRTRDTESQTQKSRTERIENMKGAFQVVSDKLKNKHVLLVDDVLTTGATLEACAYEILKTEGAKLSIATIGIAN